ncbi:MAG TPA: class I SAM-dependent methyltransferase [Bryobacteraceae bacterium]|jgi:ubiquinone/menaquinone biosynthesis C-methylase UbiE
MLSASSIPAGPNIGYYQRTAGSYDEWHVQTGDEHFVALKYVSSLMRELAARSVLDVGCGTGRVLSYLSSKDPSLELVGIEPEESLRRIAVERNGLPSSSIRTGNGARLPFPDQSFDVVCEFAVLHHVQPSQTRRVVGEMLRTARKAVVLSDENRFAYGSLSLRLLKLALWRLGLFPAFYWVKTGGKGYRYSEEDGVAYSFSVFDALPQISEWADRVIMVPLDRSKRDPVYQVPASSIFQPLLTSFHLMLIGVRDLEDL